ncbi:hypothetical protein AAC387_Pa02g0986 [Persea americana]
MDAFATLRLENGPLGVRNGNRRPEKSETGMGTSLEGRVTCRIDGSQIGLPVREFGAKMDAFATLRLENGPLGVRKGNRRLEKSEIGTGTSLEGRVTCRN